MSRNRRNASFLPYRGRAIGELRFSMFSCHQASRAKIRSDTIVKLRRVTAVGIEQLARACRVNVAGDL